VKLTKVTKEEFENFLKSYPRQLTRDVYRVSTPEQIQYNDFTLGVWPVSVVATHDAWGHTPGDMWGPEPGNWRICKE
jgi:hypothetical protein